MTDRSAFSVSSWYLIYSKPRQEIIAKDNLIRQGYDIYLPMVRSRRRRSNRMPEVIEPMFPRYLFISLNKESDNWAPINSTIGVSSLVKFGGQAASVPDRLISTIKLHEDQYGVQVLLPSVYKQGDRVRIVNGSFEGYAGMFLSKSGSQRVTILLNIAGMTATTQLQEIDLELVN